MNNDSYPHARHKGLVVQEMPNEVLVYDLDNNKAHCLNETSALVWRSCDGTNTVEDIVKNFENSTGGKANEDLVWLAIDQLNEIGLLESGITSKFAGTSRREVIKKIGLASVVALPIIASLVAPSSALASVSCACVQPLDCTTAAAGCFMTTCGGGGVCTA